MFRAITFLRWKRRKRMAFVFAIPEAVLRGLYLNFRFLFKEGNPLFLKVKHICWKRVIYLLLPQYCKWNYLKQQIWLTIYLFYILGQNQCYRFEVGTTNYSGWLSSPGSHSELYQPGKTLLEIRFSQVYTLDVWVSDNSQRNVRFSSLLAQNNATQIHKYPRKNFPFWEKLFFWISSRQGTAA